ncbi:MAG: hypothetical protein CM15mP120_26450 [Pseudomonadota bacterium]|nr:MAG: hypothetical protein CM15mP120_26450 [Pseudomonadota bacterium]
MQILDRHLTAHSLRAIALVAASLTSMMLLFAFLTNYPKAQIATALTTSRIIFGALCQGAWKNSCCTAFVLVTWPH